MQRNIVVNFFEVQNINNPFMLCDICEKQIKKGQKFVPLQSLQVEDFGRLAPIHKKCFKVEYNRDQKNY